MVNVDLYSAVITKVSNGGAMHAAPFTSQFNVLVLLLCVYFHFFSALTLLVGRQEKHQACKKLCALLSESGGCLSVAAG